MKKWMIFFLCAVPGLAIADYNPMFGEKQNQVGLYVGQGTGGSNLLNLVWPGWWEYVPFQYYELQYSQPMTVLRLPARMNIHAGYTVGFGEKDGEDWRDYSWPMFGLSWDVALLNWRGFYVGAGLGPYIKWQVDDRQDSRFVFGSKFFVGYNLSERFNIELATKHYSNGNLTPINSAYNFAGVQMLVNF